MLIAFILSWTAVIGVLFAWYTENRAHDRYVQSILDRVESSPRVTLRPHVGATPLAEEITYVSDLPYHDELWDDFTAANEAASPTSDDE